MKHCPTCQRTFDDEKVFCGGDGTRLVSDAPPAYAEQQSAPQPQQSPPPPQPQSAPQSPLSSWPSTPAAPPSHDYQSPPPAAPQPAPQYQATPPSHAEPQHAATPAHAGPLERIRCEWCQAMNEATALSCRACGAPLDMKNLISESGWREAPRIKDMTEIHFGASTCQVEGEIVPVAEINLGPGDSIFFEHHVMLWKDDRTPMSVMPLQGGIKRALAGMPFIISVAHGPGRIAFSRDATGELVVMPLHPGVELDVREHAFLLASHHISYSYIRIKGLRNILFGGQGMFMDRFVTGNEPGLLLMHGYGNVFERYLQAGESIMVEPGAFLYKDASVTMNVETQKLTSGFFGGTGMNLARMTGPGRVGIQSMYVHHHTD